jgi:polyisoprenoid-binding protein YceI
MGLMFTTSSGGFTIDTGNVNITNDLATSSVFVQLNAKSISSGNSKRDGYLTSNEWFDVEKYPVITFKASSIKKSDGEKYKYIAIGELTVKDVTKTVELPFNYVGAAMNEYEKNNAHTFTGEFVLNRQDYHVGTNHPLVKDMVSVHFSVETYKR